LPWWIPRTWFLLLLVLGLPGLAPAADRITILVDAFGERPSLAMDWGFSALVEHRGKRILFDTGNNAEIFARNVEALKVDLRRLDFVVISHRHGDHTSGLPYVLKLNPGVPIYAVADEHFGGPTPPAFLERLDPALPPRMRYFGGKLPPVVPHGTVWTDAKITLISRVTEVSPGVRLIPSVLGDPGTGLPELSLSLDTDEGQTVVVGCSHPGIDAILEAASAPSRPVQLIVGGLHWTTMSDGQIADLIGRLKDKWGVRGVAPGHCTGEPAFAALQKAYGSRYRYAGLGTLLEVSK
jgi:7,8-dihydropterin-6-yl-methyl-4-(beta-D-ribofuranosyl)aminobenzene 5'-phosphate synthase